MFQFLQNISPRLSIPLVVGGIYLIYQLVVVFYNLYLHPLAKFPGPATRTGVHLGDYWNLLRGSHPHSVREIHEQYGSVVRIRPDTLTFNTSGAWKDIYGSRPGKGQLPKDKRFYTTGGDLKSSIIYSSDADHTRMRKLLSHAFSDSALRQQEDILKKYFTLLVDGLKTRINANKSATSPASAIVDLSKWYNFLTFDVIGDLCFGESFGALESGEYHVWMANLFEGIKYARFLSTASFYEPLHTIMSSIIKIFPAVARAKHEHEQFCISKAQTRLDSKTDRKDFMGYILRHNDERGMTEEEIKNTSEILIIAGSETTATLLSGVTYLLLKNPEVYEKVQKETRDAFKTAEEMTLVSTSQLPYLHACLEEALRMYPPVPLALPRRTGPEGAIIDGIAVPPNTAVGVAQYATYHSANNFTDPEAFVPERWLPDAPEKYRNDNKEALNPFSTGPRNCIGKNLAYNEMRSVMARMLWHFDMELAEPTVDWLKQDVFFMWAKPPLNVKLTHRK